jgi:hypothetical protein
MQDPASGVTLVVLDIDLRTLIVGYLTPRERFGSWSEPRRLMSGMRISFIYASGVRS